MRRKRDLILDVNTVAVALCAVLLTGLRLREAFSHPAPDTAPRPKQVHDWKQYASRGIRSGPPDAPVTIIEFGDIACPFCARAAPYLRALRRRYPDAVTIIYRHYPLHPHSFMGAVALECASNAGTFDAMYRDLIASDSLGLKSWSAFAAEAGVSDVAAFERCMADTATLGAVVKDTLAAKRLGAPGTPTFIVNGLMIPGFFGAQEMDRYIHPLLQASPVQNHRQ